MSKVINIHFTNGQRLKLNGNHVPPFFDKYKEAMAKEYTWFTSESEDRVLINISEVCFIKEYEDADATPAKQRNNEAKEVL